MCMCMENAKTSALLLFSWRKSGRWERILLCGEVDDSEAESKAIPVVITVHIHTYICPIFSLHAALVSTHLLCRSSAKGRTKTGITL